MDNEFFILFNDKAEHSLNYPYHIELEKLLNYSTALLYYKKNILDDWDNVIDLKPIIITSNKNLCLQHRHVLSENEFKSFCDDTLPGYKGISGIYEIQVFQHFVNIKNGVYTRAYQSRKHDVWHEDKTGNLYEFQTDEGWTTSNEMINSWVIAKQIEEERDKK